MTRDRPASAFAPLLAPFLFLFAAFTLYPLLRSLYLAFVHATPSGRSIGLTNFRFMLSDRLFWIALLNTTAYTAAFVVIQLPLSLGLALLVNHRRLVGRGLWRFLFFSTHLVGPVFVAVLFAQLLDPTGPVNAALSFLLRRRIAIDALGDPVLARVVILAAGLWLSVGFGMIYLLAALQGIDERLNDAARIDGAGAVARFIHVTLPAIRPVLALLILVGTVAGFQLFELPYVLFPTSTGPGQAGLTLVGYLFLIGISAGDLGYASAVGWALVLIVGTLTLGLAWPLRRARRA